MISSPALPRELSRPEAAPPTLRRVPLDRAAPSQQRAIGARLPTSFLAVFHDGHNVTHCRVVELSASGLVMDLGRDVSGPERNGLMRLQLYVPGQSRPVQALARFARSLDGTRHAYRFASISDVSRLTLMELLDAGLAETRRAG